MRSLGWYQSVKRVASHDRMSPETEKGVENPLEQSDRGGLCGFNLMSFLVSFSLVTSFSYILQNIH